MPRVKAITTGSIPSFVDVILNFAESDTSSTLGTQDTWLAQIKAKDFGSGKGKLVMYGDDTWLKLFPDFFERADGTSSFFVSVSANRLPSVNRSNGLLTFDGVCRTLLKWIIM
jgi:ethanolaminephosphotransferase